MGSVLAVAGLALSQQASGAVLFEAGGWRAEVADVFAPDVSLVVDFVSLQQNILVLEKFATFRSINTLSGQPDSIVITFTQTGADNQTVSRIGIADATLTNQTGQRWTGFREILTGPTSFDQAQTGQYVIAPFTTRSFPNPREFAVGGGPGINSGSTWFSGTGPFNLAWNVDLAQQGQVVFSLKELPVIPAPGALALLGLGGIVAGRRRR